MAVKHKLKIANEYLSRVLKGEDYMLLDGGMGTLIQAAGLHALHSIPDILNITHPDEIASIQKMYVEAGSDCITTNTFNTNRIKLKDSDFSVLEIYQAAADIARSAGAKLVSADIGPTGALLEPIGTMTFDEAYKIFSEQARAAKEAGCDLILIETMTDLLETKAAVLAAVENTDLPIFATMTFGEGGRTVLGTTPEIAATTISSLGASATGINCSLGPQEIVPLIERFARYDRALVMAQPNAGLPRIENSETVFDIGPKEFASHMEDILNAGATIIGGCCGTTPEHICELRALIDSMGRPKKSKYQPAFTTTSSQEMVSLPKGSANVAVIGERINPTGREKLKDALKSRNFDYIIGEGAAEEKSGADILDVNVGVPGIDEIEVLESVTRKLQSTLPIPIQLDSSDPLAIEAAARSYAGRPIINSVNGKSESLSSILPIVAHYGCCVVGLTLDEQGIPKTAEDRLGIAQRIVCAAKDAGIPEEDVAIDCLVMTASTNQDEVREILRAVTLVKEELGVRTVLGVSNVSFGLPGRSLINSTFLAAAFGAGLDMPILDPLNQRYMDTVFAYRALNGDDRNCEEFIKRYSNALDPYLFDEAAPNGALLANGQIIETEMRSNGDERNDKALTIGKSTISADDNSPFIVKETFNEDEECVIELCQRVLEGRKDAVAEITDKLLENYSGLDIVNDIFIPVLDIVGRNYDNGTFFLPQLMASAEAVKSGFDIIRTCSSSESAGSPVNNDDSIIIATVQGDVHDIGKNIVKMLLENYGFHVIDLGRDVSPQDIVDAARKTGARLVGLSALMTTTVKSMKETVDLLHEQLPDVSTMVGGAVITQEFADEIGAEFYAKDAAASARIASAFFKE